MVHELGIKQYRWPAYHPESQGALERFHQTLKNIIKSYCFDTEKDWDEGFHLLLFAFKQPIQFTSDWQFFTCGRTLELGQEGWPSRITWGVPIKYLHFGEVVMDYGLYLSP